MTLAIPLPPPAEFSGKRAHFLALADDLVNAAQRFSSPAGALLRLPGPQSASGAWSDGLEGYARTFLAAAFRAAGNNDAESERTLERYASGLSAGVNPEHTERWPRFDERRQAIPEAASIAIGLAETRPWLWDQLTDRTREQTIAWMSGVLGRTDFHSNWLWFQNVIEAFLASVGAEDCPADLQRNAEFAESLYVGHGWHSDSRGRDGERQSFDWYSGWAWHVYPLLEARIRGCELDALQKKRLREFLTDAVELIGARGEPVLFGRSLTYRFAVLAPFWAGAMAGATPLQSGETRALAAATIRHFLENGAVDENGVLPIGWHSAFPRLRQLYTGGSSPYWASKAFLGLLLPEDSPEWQTEAKMPAREVIRAHDAPGWLIVSTPEDGIVRLLNHGSDRMHEPRLAARADDPFYRRVGYSNVTSPQLGGEAVANPRESHTTLLDTAGQPAHRDSIERVFLSDSVAISRSRMHWLDAAVDTLDAAGWAGLRLGPVLTTASIVHGTAELRLAWWHSATAASGRAVTAAEADSDAAWPHDEGPWRVSFGGWPLADADAEASANVARAQSRRAVSTVIGIGDVDKTEIITRIGTDPFGRRSVTPIAAGSAAQAEGRIAAALISLVGAGQDSHLVAPTLTLNGSNQIEVRWRDGAVDLVPTNGPVTL